MMNSEHLAKKTSRARKGAAHEIFFELQSREFLLRDHREHELLDGRHVKRRDQPQRLRIKLAPADDERIGVGLADDVLLRPREC